MNLHRDLFSSIPDAETPYYYFSTDAFLENVQALKNKLHGHAKLCYSLKANPWFIDAAQECCDYIEVCSYGELQTCLCANLPMDRLSVGGVAKTRFECEQIVLHAPHRVSAESLFQLSILEEMAAKHNTTLSVLFRLTSGNQFGMPMEIIRRTFMEQDQYPHLHLKGIHYYPGTQKKRVADAENTVRLLTSLAQEEMFPEIQFGAGFGVPLYAKQSADEFTPYIDCILEGIALLSNHCEVVLECGRYLAYSAGSYVSTVLEVKEQCGRKFLIIDGGIHHLNYYGQIDGHQLPIIHKANDTSSSRETYTICGSLCTANDILAKNAELPQMQAGDILIFHNAGAYSSTESRALFLSRDLPAVIMKTGTETILKRKPFPTYQLNCSHNRKE